MMIVGSSLAAIALAVILVFVFATRRNKNVSVASVTEQQASQTATPVSFSSPKGLPGKMAWQSFSSSVILKTKNRAQRRKAAAKKRTAH